MLLTIAMVGVVSAQVTTNVALSGGITLIDQAGNAKFAPDGSGYDTLAFTAAEKEGKYGFTVKFNDILDDLSGIPTSPTSNKTLGGLSEWNVFYVGKYVKYTLGQSLSNSTFRAALATSNTTFYRLSGISDKSGILVQSTTLGDLVLGAFFPVTYAGGPSVDMLKGADFGVKYTMKDVGFAQGYVNLATGANKVGVGFTYTAVKGLTAAAVAEVGIDAKSYSFGASAQYTGIEKLTAILQACDVITTSNAFEVYGKASYDVLDNVTAVGWGKFVSTGKKITAGAFVDYGFANGLTLEGNTSYDFSAKKLSADLTLYYGVSF